jgi:hypothetical protein
MGKVYKGKKFNPSDTSHVLGDSKWLWISMASMYENVCGKYVGGVELTFV